MLPPIRPKPTRPSCMREPLGNSLAPVIDLADSPDVATAFERRLEPDTHDGERFRLADRPLAEREHVRVVVRSVPDRNLLVPAEAAADAAHAVGDHRFAITRPAE